MDVIGLCNDLGLKVFEFAGLPKDSSGLIRKAVGGSYEIYVNAGHSNARRRFTIAHELAHWILHRDLIGDGLIDDALYRSGLPIRVEVEANKCAAEILMPVQQVSDRWQDPETDLESMAALFEVSTSAMAITLGLPVNSG